MLQRQIVRETQTLPSKTQFSSLRCASARYPKVHFSSHSTVRYYICNNSAILYCNKISGTFNPLSISISSTQHTYTDPTNTSKF